MELLKDAAFVLGTLGLLCCIPLIRNFCAEFYRATSDKKGHFAAIQGASAGLFIFLIIYWPLVRALRRWLL